MQSSHGLAAFCVLLFLSGCTKGREAQYIDRPRLTPNVTLRDVTFYSTALNRDMPYRVILPTKIPVEKKLPVVYLLHGRGENFRSWSNNSDVAQFAEQGLILVMPEGRASYYTNSVKHPQDRYEDYIAHDLLSEVESRFPAAKDRAHRAVVGVSMGGFGAVKLAFDHPDLFAFAGAMSAAIDVPSRRFSWRRLQQSLVFNAIFGTHGSDTRRQSDPFVFVTLVDPAIVPYLFLTCGRQESLLRPNKRFSQLLEQHRFPYEFHMVPGEHNWNQWNAMLPMLFRNLKEHLQQ